MYPETVPPRQNRAKTNPTSVLTKSRATTHKILLRRRLRKASTRFRSTRDVNV